MSEISFVQAAASRKLSVCKCGSYPQCSNCVLFRLVVRLLDAMSTREPTTATGRMQRDAVSSAAQELAAAEPARENPRD